MQITFDQRKNEINKAKHGFDFAALTVEFFAAATVQPAKQDRFLAIGNLNGAVVVAVVFRPLGTEALSVISMRRASEKERKLAHG